MDCYLAFARDLLRLIPNLSNVPDSQDPWSLVYSGTQNCTLNFLKGPTAYSNNINRSQKCAQCVYLECPDGNRTSQQNWSILFWFDGRYIQEFSWSWNAHFTLILYRSRDSPKKCLSWSKSIHQIWIQWVADVKEMSNLKWSSYSECFTLIQASKFTLSTHKNLCKTSGSYNCLREITSAGICKVSTWMKISLLWRA